MSRLSITVPTKKRYFTPQEWSGILEWLRNNPDKTINDWLRDNGHVS